MLNEVLNYLYGTMVYRWPVKELYGGTFEIKEGSIELPLLLFGYNFFYCFFNSDAFKLFSC